RCRHPPIHGRSHHREGRLRGRRRRAGREVPLRGAVGPEQNATGRAAAVRSPRPEHLAGRHVAPVAGHGVPQDHPDRRPARRPFQRLMAATTTPTPTAGLHRKPIATLSRNPADPRSHVDWGLLAGTIAIAVGGLVAIYTAAYQNRTIAGLDTLYFVKRQGLAIAVGILGTLVVMMIDYRKLRDISL